ncbi:hypothetical protein [Vibrio bivalvicida]|uniref:Uncharacterized protein n=1 Tax=Vibrio bivalvicida TaxID=1276888 RepID=A0A177Y398_9VIBR|nr:hypothetical protein [Vibrio bivalvicida]OAJ95349.1 hypothetical protein APB76_05135 [Vibrio bivalvicida]
MKPTALAFAISALCVSATYVQAKPAKPALVDIEPVSCTTDVDDPVSMVDVEWMWSWETGGEDSPPHTKFGGDADLNVTVSATDNLAEPTVTLTDYPFSISFSVSMLDEEEDQANELVYSCEDPEIVDDVMSANCTGSLEISELVELASMGLSDMFPEVEEWEEVEVTSATLDDVRIKAMDPSVGVKRMKYQKYPLVSLCLDDE